MGVNVFGHNKTSIGLDLGATGVRAVEMAWRDGRPTVERAAAVAYDSPITDWANADQQRLANFIVEVTQRQGMRGRWVAHAVSGEAVAPQYFNFPQLMPEDIPEAVRIEVETALPFRAETALISYTLFPEQRQAQGKVRTHGLAIAADGPFVESRMAPIRRANLEAFCMEPASSACVNALIACHTLENNVNAGVLNIGYRYSNLALTGSGGTLLVRDVPWAGAHLTEEIAAKMGVPSAEAEEMKRRHWQQAGAASAQPLLPMAEILQTGARDFVVRLRDTIEYWISEKLIGPLTRIYLTGGGSQAPELPEFLSQSLNVPVERWAPPLGSAMTGIRYEMTVAYGLALRKFDLRKRNG